MASSPAAENDHAGYRSRAAVRVGRLLRTLLLLLCATVGGGTLAAGPATAYRIGLTPVFLDDKTSFLKQWEHYLERRLAGPVEFVQRQTYREITELLLQGQLDAAWICGFPYVRNSGRIRLLAVPLFQGEPLYRSYLIVPSEDRETRDIADLRGAVFAYSDPDSNSGYLVPQVHLLTSRLDPRVFFARTFFAWAHRDVVRAVASGLAQGGAVDGYVWETLARTHPELTRRTRVVTKSEKFGFPPFVAPASLPEDDFRRIQRALMDMGGDAEGRRLLALLNLDGFVAGSDRLFDGIRDEVRLLDKG